MTVAFLERLSWLLLWRSEIGSMSGERLLGEG